MPPSSSPARLTSIEWQITRRTSAAEPACGELSTAQGRALLAEAAALGVERALLAGGDPSARGDLAELIAHGAAAGLAVHVAAPPCPQALAAALPALAEAGLRGLSAALHGPDGKGHDTTAASPGSFAATVDLLQGARELGLELEIRTALLPGRLRVLPAMAQIVSSVGAARWTVVAPVASNGAAAGAPIGALALERALVTLSDLAAMFRFEVAAIAAPHLARVVRMRHGGSPEGPAGRVRIERDGVERLFVSAAGEVFPSAELPVRVGVAHNTYPGEATPRDGAAAALEAALAHPVIEELRSGQRLTGKCGVCSFQRICGGSRARAYAATSALWAEDPSCAYVPKAARAGAG